MKIFSAVLVAALVALAGAANAAPSQLYNKTVSFGWTANNTMRGPDGTKATSSVINYIVYVSAQGRLFERSSRASRKRLGTSDTAPGAARTNIGEARGATFEGNRMVVNRGYAGAGGSGAMRASVTFNPSYSECSVSVMLGKENGTLKRRGLDGVVREMLSFEAVNQTCSVREGNPFAN